MTVSARRARAQYLGVVAAVAVAATAIRWALRKCAVRPLTVTRTILLCCRATTELAPHGGSSTPVHEWRT